MLNKEHLLEYNTTIDSFFSKTNRHFLFSDVNEVVEFFENVVKKEYISIIQSNDIEKIHLHSVYTFLLENIHFVKNNQNDKVSIPKTITFIEKLYKIGHKEVEKNKIVGMFASSRMKSDKFVAHFLKNFMSRLKEHNRAVYYNDNVKKEREDELISLYKNLINFMVIKKSQFEPDFIYDGKPYLLTQKSNIKSQDVIDFENKYIIPLKENILKKENDQKIKALNEFKLFIQDFNQAQNDAKNEIRELFTRSNKKIATF